MNDSNDEQPSNKDDSKNFKTRLLFFLGITTMGALGGFGAMLSRTERQNQKLKQGQQVDPVMTENGIALARKALGRATLYSVGGFSLFCLVVWKMIGAKDFEEFRMKLGNAFPKIHRPREPEVIDWDETLYGKSEDTKPENVSGE
ncbi:transmembrane protein 242-like [Styela clava]